MPDIKFACPGCQQHIQAEQAYAGMQITCPACGAGMVVPGSPPPSASFAPAPSLAPASAPSAASGTGCPSCGTALPRGAVLCTKCGYNRATGQRTVAGRPAPLGARMAPSGETKWYQTAYPYLGLTVAILGVLYFLGKNSPPLHLLFVATAYLISLTIHIIVVVAAFKESVGTGFLTLCIPFYALYFVFKVSENSTLQLLYLVAVVLNLILGFIAQR